VKTTIEKIGPKTAAKYLENQSRNRPLHKPTVAKYAAAMLAGAWTLVHQGIAFDKEGKLFDGQHRMAAVVQSGKTIEFMVSRYVNTEDAPMAIVDSGRTRSAGDRIMIAGIVPGHGALISSIIGALRIADSGVDSRHHIHPHEIEMIYGAESEHIQFVIDAFGVGFSKQWNAVIRAAFAYCHAFAPEEVFVLATMVKEKCGYQNGSAAHAFVVALADDKLVQSRSMTRTDCMAKVLWLIRQHIEGKRVERVKATASIFNWAKRQRQIAGVATIAETLG
jgi:hypothetical protein